MDRTSAKEFVSLLYYLITFFSIFFSFFFNAPFSIAKNQIGSLHELVFPFFSPLFLVNYCVCISSSYLYTHIFLFFLLSLSHPYYIFISWSLSLLSSKGFNSSFTIFISLFFFLNCLQIYNSAVRRARFEDKKQGLKNRTVACAIKYIY